MISVLLSTLNNTIKFINQSVADLSDQEMVEQPTGIPNHATWTLGHIIYCCQGVAVEIGFKGWLPDEWESIFGYGSTPVSDVSRYPSKSELLKTLKDTGVRINHIIANLSETTMKQSLSNVDIPTIEHLVYQVVISHTAFHAGQLAMWRRAVGKKSSAVFV